MNDPAAAIVAAISEYRKQRTGEWRAEIFEQSLKWLSDFRDAETTEEHARDVSDALWSSDRRDGRRTP
jgi:hypothetical protein